MIQRFIAWLGLFAVIVLVALGCGNRGTSKTEEVTATERSALTLITQHDWEDGTLKGWIPRGGTVVLTNTTEAAADGTRSLKTTGRTAGFNGPSLNVFPMLVKGATYEFTVKARLVTGELGTTVKTTMQQTSSTNQQSFVQVAGSQNATDAGFITLTGSYSYSATADITGLLFYVESASATASYYIDSFSITETLPPPGVNILHDWENGTLQGWVPRGGGVVLTNTTDAAFDGVRSLRTTNRTAGFHGPSLSVLGTLRKGATYQVTVRARLVAPQAAATLRVTVQRTPVGQANQFDTVASMDGVTDAAFVTLSGLYSFTTDVTGLLLYVESPTATASYYIDGFQLTELAPPPGPPGNTTGHAAAFESGTTEGWASRTGTEIVSVSTADAHTGTRSLLTTNRTNTFRGPALNVTNVMFNGSRYRVELWAKLAPGEADAQLRVSLQRNLGSNPATFHTVIGNTPVTANAWVRLVTTYDVALANTGLQLYVETNSPSLASFYIDDVNVSWVPPPEAERPIASVKQTFANFFPIGAAIHAGDLTGEHAFLLTKHHSSATSENDMKWSSLQNVEGAFTYATADAQVAFAKANGLRFRGHTFVWHQQTPAWVFNDASGQPLTPTPENKALLLGRMETHIRAVAAHFGSDVYAWDVVNEVIDPSQADGFRRSPWFNVTGTDYIDRAFQVAREVAPNAELYINDFDTTNTTKRQFLFNLVSDLRSRGIPVDGVGHQMHNNVDFPSRQAIVDTIELFHGLGVKNEVTELDVSIYSNSLPGPIVDYFDIPEERLVQQGYRYRTFFDAFKSLQGKIASVTFWGQADDHTWLASSTRTNAPLLFDTSLKSKHAYWGVVDPLQLPGADVTVSLAAASPSVNAGQSLGYALVVANEGDENPQPFEPADDDLPAANVSLTGTLPAGTVFDSLAVPPGWVCTTPPVGGIGPITCTLESLAVNASDAFALGVKPLCSTPDGSALVSTASASSTTLDPNLAPNNSATATSLVSNPPPVVTLVGPTEVSLECGTSFLDPGATAEDACDGPVAVTTTGTVNTGLVGLYPLVYDALDSAGGSALDVTRLVSVVDTTAPAFDAFDLTVLLPGVKVVLNNGVLYVNGQPFPLDEPITILGQTIEFVGEAIIINGQSFLLDGRTVVLLPTLGQYQTFTIADLIAALAPDCDANLDLGDVVIDLVTSDEVDNAPGGSDGNTTNDISLASDCRSVRLRVERDNGGNGRVYTVRVRVRDASGNTTTKALRVIVPRIQGSGSGVDDGPNNVVTGNCP
jgi:endo-1,4-beta-xylanase